MANLVFLPVADKLRSGTYLLYDCACGTGGMLTVAEETVKDIAKAHGKQIATHLYGQEINAEREGDGQSKTRQLTDYLKQGKKIIISTVQTFPFVLDKIGKDHRGKKFAIIIDEAHSSQGGRTAAAMSMALSAVGAEEEGEATEDKINRIIESRKLLPNASYFAFTATPKNKTLQIFGIPYRVGDEIKHRPFHSYTMKQAIQEGFILGC